MIILGIESTCDETAASLVEDGRHLLSNVISTSVKEQALYGGVVPEIASRRHCEFISATVKKALLDAGKTIDDVDAVAVTFAPGSSAQCWWASTLPRASPTRRASRWCRSTICGATLQPLPDPPGAEAALPLPCGVRRTQPHRGGAGLHPLPHPRPHGGRRRRRSFDKVARTLGLPYPGGPSVANAAKTGDPKAYRLPVPHVEGRYNVSFSGLKTAVLNEVNQAQMKGTDINVPDLAASFQERIAGILAEKLLLAAADTGAKAGLSGGRRRGQWPSAPAGQRRRPEAGGQGLPARVEILRRQRRDDRGSGLLSVHRGPYRRAGAERSADSAH